MLLAGHTLTAPVVFTSLALFNVLIAPLNSFPWVINGVVEAAVSLRRLRRCGPQLSPQWKLAGQASTSAFCLSSQMVSSALKAWPHMAAQPGRTGADPASWIHQGAGQWVWAL